MRGLAMHLDIPADDAFMADDRFHTGRLADDHCARLWQICGDIFNQAIDANAADLLVVG